MKTTLAILALLCPVALFGQTAARYDLPALMTTPGGPQTSAPPALLAVKNATVSVCGYPATLVSGMCTNTITTYTSASEATSCPSTAQLTMPGKSICQSQTDLQGNLGFWYDQATNPHVVYTVKTAWGTAGPYDISQPNATGCPLSGCTYSGTVNGPNASFTDVTASCSKVGANADSRCQAGPNLGARIAAAIAAAPANGVIDASSDLASGTISSTITLGSNKKLILPCEAITTTVAPAIIANGNGWQISGCAGPAYRNTQLVPSVHGPVIEVTGDSGQWTIQHLMFDYSTASAGSPSTVPEDKAIVLTGGTANSDQNITLSDLVIYEAYDGIWDGDCASGSSAGQCHSFSFTGTDSNVAVIDTVYGLSLGDGVIQVGLGSGIHDQYTVKNSGCNGAGVASGLACIYFQNTNNLKLDQVWAWHLNDGTTTPATNLAPTTGFSGIRLDTVLSCSVDSSDYEADHLTGTSDLLYINNSKCKVDNFSTFGNVFGGSLVGSSLYQSYIHVSGSNSSAVLGGGIWINGLGSDSCSASNATVYDASLRNQSAVINYAGGLFANLPAMPSGTNCVPQTFSNTNVQSDVGGPWTANGEYQVPGDLTVGSAGVNTVIHGGQVTQTQGTNPPVNGYIWSVVNFSTGASTLPTINGVTIGVSGLPVSQNCTAYYRPSGVGTGSTAQYDVTAVCAVGNGGVSDYEVYMSPEHLAGAESYTKSLTVTAAGQIAATSLSLSGTGCSAGSYAKGDGSGCGSGGSPVFPASLTTTAAASDNLTVTGMTSSGHCSLTPTNASAATNVATTYISAKATNQITITHTATSGMTYDALCVAN